MEVIFVRTGQRRYAIEIHRPDGNVLRMDPAPGFDEFFPHDLQHLIVEEQLGLTSGIFGRLAKGGTASTFAPVGGTERLTKREAARRRRRLQRVEGRLADTEPPQFAESERATYVAWHDWLSGCPEVELRRRAVSMANTAADTVERMDNSERARLEAALVQMRERIDDVARHWHALDIGESMSINWSPADVSRRSRWYASGRS